MDPSFRWDDENERTVPTSPRIASALLSGTAALIGLAGFVACFWLLLGRGETSTAREIFAATCGTAWLLAVMYAAHRIARAAAQADAERQAAARAVLDAERQRERDRAVEALANEPRWQRFWPLIRRWRITDLAWLDAAEQRYLELLADPRRAHHAPGVLQGVRWNDAQLAYFDDPAARVTCVHLQPVETALRRAERQCWPQGPAEIGTDAALQFDVLRTRFELAPCVRESYEEPHSHASPREYLRCEACRSAIESGNGEAFPAA